MPLSEHEQRLLEQMERALYAEDPKFATALRGADPRTHYRRRILWASVLFLAGIALLVTGVVTEPVISVIGFLVMLGAAFFALTSWRQIPGANDLGVGSRTTRRTGGRKPRQRSRSRGGLMSRFEDRWNRRRGEGGR
ncbi:MAG: DUF3040 domain-containing protein [Actinomycetota bacterium]|nr:DUF3040 domain-containing protein [Actinomycetota bacterium]